MFAKCSAFFFSRSATRAAITFAPDERAADLQAIRARWADATNAALEQAGQSAQVDSRSNLARRLMRATERKIGPLGSPAQWYHVRQQRAARRATNRPAPSTPEPRQRATQPRLQTPQPPPKAKTPPRPQPPAEPSIYQRIARAGHVTEDSLDVPFIYGLKFDPETRQLSSPLHPALDRLMSARQFHEHGVVSAHAPLKAIGQMLEKQPSIATDVLTSITQHSAFRPELDQKQAAKTAKQNRNDFQRQQQREARDIEREIDGWGLD